MRRQQPGVFRPRFNNRGFTMIEILVSLVLLSGGLLSVAYMQNYALQFGQESYHRGQTLVSANELIEGMRAMQVSTTSAGNTLYTDPVSASEAALGCNPALATPRNDAICFHQQVAQNLPFGTMQIEQNAADGRYYDVTVFWSDRGVGQQANFTDADTDDADVNLNSKAACNAADNKIWSDAAGLEWPFAGTSAPAVETCMTSHTWSVQILDPGIL